MANKQFKIGAEKLGEGNYGKVYRGSVLKNGIWFDAAIKKVMYDPDDFGKIKKEYSILKSIADHDHIIKILGIETDESIVYIILELCEMDLEKYLTTEKPSLQQKTVIMHQSASALAFMHNLQPAIVHRDVKPGNILIKINQQELVTKITDFGFARIFDPDGSKRYMRSKVGTPMYLAPEQFDSREGIKYTAAVDVFSLGLVYLVIMTCDDNPRLEPNPEILLKEDFLPYAQHLLNARSYNKPMPVMFTLTAEDTWPVCQIKLIINQMAAFDAKHRIPMTTVHQGLSAIVSANKEGTYYQSSITALKKENEAQSHLLVLKGEEIANISGELNQYTKENDALKLQLRKQDEEMQQNDHESVVKAAAEKDQRIQMLESEVASKTMTLQSNKSQISKLKEDLQVNTKEGLNIALFEKDVFEKERCEACEALSRAELCKAELELEINKVKTEEASLRDDLLKMQALNEGLGQDKIELNKIIMQMDLEKNQLYGEKGSVEQEKFGLMEELSRVEQEKMDVENEKSGILHTLILTETLREKLEQEIMGLNRKRAELIEQLNAVTRRKNTLAEELLSARKEIERQSDTNVRIAKEKEELTRDKAELTVQLTTSKRENRQQSEGNTLNTTLSDSSYQIGEMHERAQQLQRALTSSEHDRRVLQERLDNTRAAFNEAKKQNHSLIERVQGMQNKLSDSEVRRAELETQIRSSHVALGQRQETEQELNQRLQKMQNEKGSMNERISALQRNLAAIEKEKSEVQRVAVCSKKDKSALEKTFDKVMSLLEQDKASLEKKLSNTSQNLETANVDYDKLKLETAAKQEGDRNTILNLNSELTGFRELFEKTCFVHEKEVKDMNNAMHDLDRRNKEGALREVAELKIQLKMVEGTRGAIRRDLIDANRAIREGDEAREIGRKEIIDLKRNVNKQVHEKEVIQQTAHDLRYVIKKIEGEKTELIRLLGEARQRIGVLEEQKAALQKEASDLHHSLREVEKARLDSRRELQDLRRQVKMLDVERNKLGHEGGELPFRVAHDDQKEEERRTERFGPKKKVVGMDANHEVLCKELNLQRKMAEVEDEARLKDKHYHLALEDSHRLDDQKLDDQRRSLEIRLENANAEPADLKLKCSGTQTTG